MKRQIHRKEFYSIAGQIVEHKIKHFFMGPIHAADERWAMAAVRDACPEMVRRMSPLAKQHMKRRITCLCYHDQNGFFIYVGPKDDVEIYFAGVKFALSEFTDKEDNSYWKKKKAKIPHVKGKSSNLSPVRHE